MNPNYAAVSRPRLNTLEANKVLKNTYMLLSATLAFSAVMAMVSMSINMPPMAYLISVIVAIVLGMFVLPKTANSSAGIGVIFLITGLLGFGLGSILTVYMAMANGPQIIATALGGTGIIFLGLSGYALTTKKDFSFLGGFLFAGMMVIVLAIIASLFIQIPALTLTISAAIIMLMSGMILFDTSRIINGGETNYIMATYSIFLSLFNIFISLLNILGIMSSD
ncbi:MAG TPA: Bax inhibitor-1/YccA family protein [Gammaproteobacteria bacterium]|nr:modulator of FtsH protease YccA [bacterium BMS3Abin11]HDH16517.1 Bax inhibitor-1/YccA family protein [Gammaproteobacteria bacterium]HDZ78784.1 Bax inhibitor-1/YccA family protein [Gammaproteobacteria bacterium]